MDLLSKQSLQNILAGYQKTQFKIRTNYELTYHPSKVAFSTTKDCDKAVKLFFYLVAFYILF
jgi:hypothetical protein